jgi:hypothetical protein
MVINYNFQQYHQNDQSTLILIEHTEHKRRPLHVMLEI